MPVKSYNEVSYTSAADCMGLAEKRLTKLALKCDTFSVTTQNKLLII